MRLEIFKVFGDILKFTFSEAKPATFKVLVTLGLSHCDLCIDKQIKCTKTLYIR